MTRDRAYNDPHIHNKGNAMTNTNWATENNITRRYVGGDDIWDSEVAITRSDACAIAGASTVHAFNASIDAHGAYTTRNATASRRARAAQRRHNNIAARVLARAFNR